MTLPSLVAGSIAQYESIGDPTSVSGSCAAGSNNDTLAIAIAYIWAADTGSSWSCTFNSNSMTIMGNYLVGAGRIIIFGYPAGNSPGSQTVAFTSNASSGSVWLNVGAFYDCAQTSWTDTSATATATDNNPDVNLTPNYTDTCILAACIVADNEAPVEDDETEFYNNYPGYGEGLGSIYYLSASATQRNMNWTKTGTEEWSALAVNFRGVAGGSPQTITGAGAIASGLALGSPGLTRFKFDDAFAGADTDPWDSGKWSTSVG